MFLICPINPDIGGYVWRLKQGKNGDKIKTVMDNVSLWVITRVGESAMLSQIGSSFIRSCLRKSFLRELKRILICSSSIFCKARKNAHTSTYSMGDRP